MPFICIYKDTVSGKAKVVTTKESNSKEAVKATGTEEGKTKPITE